MFTVGHPLRRMIHKKFSNHSRIPAILACSGIFIGATVDVRPCPHHELLSSCVSAQFSTCEPGDEPDHGLADVEDHRDVKSDVHECLCVDMCGFDAASEAMSSDCKVSRLVGVVDAHTASAGQVFHPRPTAVLIPLPNAPPNLT
jgi:hypothetical protein